MTKPPLVPVWVRSTICILSIAAVACTPVFSPNAAVCAAVAVVAVNVANLAFGKQQCVKCGGVVQLMQ